MRRLLPLMLLLAAALPVQAQGVKRCTDAQGNTVFTDRPCASVDAVPKGAPAPLPGAHAPGFAPRGCARTAESLLVGVRGALEARDVNRLASYYHWAGTGTRGGLQVMDELEAIANRPFVAIALAYPDVPDAAPGTGSGSLPGDRVIAGEAAPAGVASLSLEGRPGAAAGAATLGSEPDPVPGPVRGVAPVGLEVQQMAGDAHAGSRSTRFRLQRHIDCWWLEL